jgi:hypothetical protein
MSKYKHLTDQQKVDLIKGILASPTAKAETTKAVRIGNKIYHISIPKKL